MGSRTLQVLTTVAALAAAIGAPAFAQVIEISPDGDVATYAGPAVFTSDGAQSITANPPAAGSIAATPPPAEVKAVIRAAAARHDVSPALVEAVAWQESRFRQDAVSPKGARGVMQLMPSTARSLGVDSADLAANVEGGTSYLAGMLRRFSGDVVLALSAYNAGPGAVLRHRGVPPYPETRAYVAAILERLAAASQGVP